MLEELQPPLPGDEAPGKDTQVDGTDSVPEDGSADGSSEGNQVQPDGKKPTDDNGEVFHMEGKKVFKTKDEYIKHVNQQRGAASRLAHKTNELEQALAEARAELERQKNSASPKKDEAAPEEYSDDFKQAIANLRKSGMVTREDLETILKPMLAKYDRFASNIEAQEMSQAERIVGEFLDLNPDALDITAQIQDVLKRAETAGIQMDVYKAYYNVTGKVPRTKQATQSKQDIREVKRAQAGGKSSGNGSGAGEKKDDFFDHNF